MAKPEQSTYEQAGRSNRYVLIAGLFMLVGLVALAWLGQPPPSIAVGERLPRIDLQPMLHAEPISRDSLAGQVTVLHFWGTWCGPCQMEFPEFVKLAEEFDQTPGVKIVSVSCSPGIEKDLAKLRSDTEKFLEKQAATIPTYSDSAAMTRYQISMLTGGSLGYPTTLVVDQNGVIVEALAGYLEGEMAGLIPKIKALL